MFENKSMIEIVIERAKKIGCDLILATSSSIEDDELEEIAKKHQIYCFRGSLKIKFTGGIIVSMNLAYKTQP